MFSVVFIHLTRIRVLFEIRNNMPTIKVAAIQMLSRVGDVAGNLRQAEALVTEAAQAGAQLIVLPEVFNTGYKYVEANYQLAEAPDGPTYRWLRDSAARLGIHLAGALLLRKRGEIYDTLVLAAPDGRAWEYDKLHPCGWERAYFRAGRQPIVAETDLGKFGLMICYDAAHPDLFRAYAGRVQLIINSACPPMLGDLQIHFADETRLALADTSAFARGVHRRGRLIFNEDTRAQGHWLGVPIVQAMPSGHFSSPVPRPTLSLAFGLMFKPRLWRLIRQARHATVSAPFFAQSFIADATGQIVAQPGHDRSIALA
ncbi:MAG TPA: carbon-nitrogen hydrolase family protein, partial [Anaerolineae bacterium]